MQSDESSEFFRGVVNTDVTMVKATPSDDNNNTVNTSSYPILVELTGRMAGGTQAGEQIIDDGQVIYDSQRDRINLSRFKENVKRLACLCTEMLLQDSTKSLSCY